MIVLLDLLLHRPPLPSGLYSIIILGTMFPMTMTPTPIRETTLLHSSSPAMVEEAGYLSVQDPS